MFLIACDKKKMLERGVNSPAASALAKLMYKIQMLPG